MSSPALPDCPSSHHSGFLHRCITLAQVALAQNVLPVGAVLVTPSGTTLAEQPRQPGLLEHAELLVLREAQAWLLAHPYQATLYSSLEPCLMYLGAALNAKVGTIVFATRDGDRQFTTVLESNAYLHYKATKTHICCEPCAQARRTARDLLARYWHQQGHSTKATTFEVSTPIAHWRTPAHETACDE